MFLNEHIKIFYIKWKYYNQKILLKIYMIKFDFLCIYILRIGFYIISDIINNMFYLLLTST